MNNNKLKPNFSRLVPVGGGDLPPVREPGRLGSTGIPGYMMPGTLIHCITTCHRADLG